jgi:hypothetical protein
MRVIGFCMFITGLIMGSFWIGAIGFALYEFSGVTWMAAATTGDHGHGNNDDHGP